MKKQGAKIGKWVVAIIVIAVFFSMCSGSGGKVKLPFGSEDRIGSNYSGVITELEVAGFTNIEKETASTTKEDENGNIISITVDGESVFDEAAAYEADVPINVKYYEFKEQETAEQTEDELFTPTIKVATGGEKGWPEFTIDTNLPDKTVLKLTLEDNNLYTEQKEVTVKNGRATSKAFMEEKGMPLAGDYTLTIVMHPEDQKNKVKEEIGEHGDALTGDLIQTDSTNGNKYVYYETTYTSPYSEDELEDDEDENEENYQKMLEQIEEKISETSDGKYTMSEDSSGITINLWEDGLAMDATAAQYGYEQNKESWDSVVDTMKDLSLTIEMKALYAYGYYDRSVTINVLNDINMDLVLLCVKSGEVIYNVADE